MKNLMLTLVLLSTSAAGFSLDPSFVCNEEHATPDAARSVDVFHEHSDNAYVELHFSNLIGKKILLEHIHCVRVMTTWSDVVEEQLQCKGKEHDITVSKYSGWGPGPFAFVKGLDEHGNANTKASKFLCPSDFSLHLDKVID